MTTPAGPSEAEAPPPLRRPRGLVPAEPDLPRRAPEPPAPYVVHLDAPGVVPLERRPWRATKTAVAVVLLLAVALYAAVEAGQTLREVIDSGDDDVVDEYAAGDVGVEVEREGFSAVFPTEPAERTVRIPGADPGDRGRARTLVSTVEGTEFAITWFDLRGDVDDAGAVLSLLAAVAAEDLGGTLEDRGMQISGPAAAHEFLLERAEGVDHVRHVLVGRTVYQLRITAPEPRGKAFSRLVESFAPVTGA
jgi:hypothetical protein